MLPDVAVHIIQRGNNRTTCFFADEDYARYLFHLERLAPRFGCAVHAWCLMTNHVHLLVTPSAADSCALLMKNLGQRYVQQVNRNRDRSGTLWEGRFRSSLVQSETYLLTCYRYIELNPVRAGMVGHPGEYPWSSYRVNAEGARSGLVVPHPEYLRLGESWETRRRAYRGLVAEQVGDRMTEEIRAATNGGYALGDKAFQDRVGFELGRPAVRGMPGRRPEGSGAEVDQLF